MKRQVMGREVVVAITKGKLDFGPWEQIFYGEFDGNRPKRVLVKVIGEGLIDCGGVRRFACGSGRITESDKNMRTAESPPSGYDDGG